jgi:hypothetical protein
MGSIDPADYEPEAELEEITVAPADLGTARFEGTVVVVTGTRTHTADRVTFAGDTPQMITLLDAVEGSGCGQVALVDPGQILSRHPLFEALEVRAWRTSHEGVSVRVEIDNAPVEEVTPGAFLLAAEGDDLARCEAARASRAEEAARQGAEQAARQVIIARFARAGYEVTIPSGLEVLISEDSVERLLAQIGA